MKKNEFIEKLQRSLASGLNSNQVADNVRYYQDYIESEVRKGKTEEEVIAALGDPRLLAKSIIEANKHTGESYGSNREYDDEVADKSPNRKYEKIYENIAMMPGWLIALICIVIALIVIGVITKLLAYLAPVIIVVLIVILLIKVFQSNGKWR